MKKPLFFLMSTVFFCSMSRGMEEPLRIGEGRTNVMRLQDYRQELRDFKQQARGYDVQSLRKQFEEAQEQLKPMAGQEGKEEKEEGWQEYAQELQDKLYTYEQIERDIEKKEEEIKNLIAEMREAGEEIPSEGISLEPSTVIGAIAVITAAIIAGTLYQQASQWLKQQVKNALQEHDKEITDVSDAERQLLTAAIMSNYFGRLKPFVFRKAAARIPLDQDLSDDLWPVLYRLYYGEKPLRKEKRELKQMYHEAREQARAAAAQKALTEKQLCKNG